MRTRLIDEDVLAGESVKILTWLMERQEQGLNTTLGELHGKWIDAVRKAPTAFDPEKIIARLEEEETDSAADFELYANEHRLDGDYDDFYFMGLKRAIEVVKGGAVDGK